MQKSKISLRKLLCLLNRSCEQKGLSKAEVAKIKWLALKAPKQTQDELFAFLLKEAELIKNGFEESFLKLKEIFKEHNIEEIFVNKKLKKNINILKEKFSRDDDQSKGENLINSI